MLHSSRLAASMIYRARKTGFDRGDGKEEDDGGRKALSRQ
jgi:hypothetical protein